MEEWGNNFYSKSYILCTTMFCCSEICVSNCAEILPHLGYNKSVIKNKNTQCAQED